MRKLRPLRKRAKGLTQMHRERTRRWVVYEHRDKEFVFLSRLFATRAEADEERQKLTRTLYGKVSLGVAVVEG
jgi:hypothetical protein